MVCRQTNLLITVRFLFALNCQSMWCTSVGSIAIPICVFTSVLILFVTDTDDWRSWSSGTPAILTWFRRRYCSVLLMNLIFRIEYRQKYCIVIPLDVCNKLRIFDTKRAAREIPSVGLGVSAFRLGSVCYVPGKFKCEHDCFHGRVDYEWAQL